jgi:DNA polymerase-1
MLVHFAVGDGADAVRAQYNADPKTDYHRLTQRLVKETANVLIPRNAEESSKGTGEFGNLTIKEINFGLLYGMGEGKLAKMAKLDKKMSRTVFDAYHSGNPYVKATMKATADEVQQLGFITTIENRRSRFNEWEPDTYGQREMPLPYANAIAAYGYNIRRAKTHKAINRRLQGSAADQIKRGMLTCYQAGVYGVTGVPRLTVHDELDFSVIDDSPAVQEAHAEMRRIMQDCTPLRIPVLFEVSRGPNWGECE